MINQKIIENIKRTNFYGWYRRNFYETPTNAYNQKIIDNSETNKYIIDLLVTNKPMMISRLGSEELKTLKLYHQNKGYTQQLRADLKRASGVFPTDDFHLDKFAQLYFESIGNIDLFGLWFNPFENIVANKYCPDAKLTILKNLESYFSNNPWSYYLKGKKVLVINPLDTSISSQYKRRKKLFKDENILPEFKLITYRPVVSYWGDTEYKSWFDALESMQNDISKIDFDVAIIGAGAYGLPLASFIKQIGKQAIHLGGSTQMLFGVYGRRWEILPEFQRFINEDWVKPLKTERPKNAIKIENACFW